MMNSNPFSSPESEERLDRAAAQIQYRLFTAPVVSFKLSAASYRDSARQRAQWAIEHEIGIENVVTIIEHPAHLMSNFEVVVWYRVRGGGLTA